MELFGLLFEFLFLIMGVYLYLFTRGKITPKNPEAAKRSSAFREKNGSWLRPLSLALIAIMLINLILHIRDFLQ